MSIPAAALKQLAGEMDGRPRAGRAVAEFPWIGLGQRDEFLQVAGRQRRIDDQHRGEASHQRNRSEVAQPVIRQILAHGRAHHARNGMIEQRITVGGGAYDRVDAKRASRSALILDHHLLAEHVGQLLGGGASGEVDAAACGERDDQLDGFCRIAVLRCRTRDRQRDDAGECDQNGCKRSSRDHDTKSSLAAAFFCMVGRGRAFPPLIMACGRGQQTVERACPPARGNIKPRSPDRPASRRSTPAPRRPRIWSAVR
jgi:hypothetical protein